ncbi:alpha/beta fold hydrolase [Planococcus shenhongbingii]|uniref:Alpha/beta hydrolase n=1 Tax=Planococcus shenhongbingii TaxID=3058398 RepID=A0ABT8N7P1_9BACL|nr:alpha/beta hydrolase [Planococcus sp. N017]MDN7243887.1 alpha/beta hydrolase [Planococcus sp. N017]
MSIVKIPTESSYVEAEGIRFAYRKFGHETGIPLVFFIHFRGTMENWDPELIGSLADDRPIILFDNTGVGESSGETPSTIAEMAEDAASFIKALGYQQVDILGFSIGGMVAQEVALQQPDLVRRLILSGTAPQSGVGLKTRHDVVMAASSDDAEKAFENFMFLFYHPTESSRAAGTASLKRIMEQKKVNSSPQVLNAQSKALAQWSDRVHNQSYDRIHQIKQPVLVTNGVDDIMVPTENSYILAQQLPDAQLIIYPDSGHGHLFQYPRLFAEHVKLFLNSKKYKRVTYN